MCIAPSWLRSAHDAPLSAHATMSLSAKPAPSRNSSFVLPATTESMLPTVRSASKPLTAYTWKTPSTLSPAAVSVENW